MDPNQEPDREHRQATEADDRKGDDEIEPVGTN